jgi:LacI family transcriptional regulator
VVTSYDVAQRVGVSQTTVSRALRGHPSVLPATRAAVVAAAVELGYTVNSSARSLATRRTDTIALVLADADNLFYHQLIQLMHRAITRRGRRMLIVRESPDTTPSSDLAMLDDVDVDGAVFASATQGSSTESRFAARGLPLVLFNRDAPGLSADVLLPDDERGCALVVEHLTSLGHRRMGLVTGTPDTTSGRQRAEAFVGALRERGIAVDARFRGSGALEHAVGVDFGRRVLAEPDRPTALFCGSDTLAYGVLDAAASLGLDVPGDLSVVGFDDLEPSRWHMIGLTTIRQPLADMVEDAADVLVSRIDASDAPFRRTVYDVELIERTTTGPPGAVG